MRMIGHVIGALTMTATRRSVIFSSDGFDAVRTCCVMASRSSWVTNPDAPTLAAPTLAAPALAAPSPAAAAPTRFTNSRRSNRRATEGFIAPPVQVCEQRYLTAVSPRDYGTISGMPREPERPRAL